MISPIDKGRIWLLGTFCVAAKDTIPHGVHWANKLLGSIEPPTSMSTVVAIAGTYRRPLYHLFGQERIRLHSDPNVNAVMTGMKLLMNPHGCKLSDNEITCVLDTVEFLSPTLKQAPEGCQELINALVRSVTKRKDFDIAA